MTNFQKRLAKTLAAGDEVYWDDPDNGEASGYYNVVHINNGWEKITLDTIVYIRAKWGSEAEVPFRELS